MNQRAQFAHQSQGKKTWLIEERIKLLNDLGFIWNLHYNNGGMKRRQDAVVEEVETIRSNDDDMM
jgi:hypothetical protein